MRYALLIGVLSILVFAIITGCNSSLPDDGRASDGQVPSGDIYETTEKVITPAEIQNGEKVDLGCCVNEILVRDTALIGENSITVTAKDFIMTLNSDKKSYSTTDIVTMWGTLEYVGDNDSIEIWSSCPFMLFTIAGGKVFGSGMGGSVVDVLVSSTLEKGRVYHFDYQKSGGWSADDPNASFWESFFSEEELLLPVGEYTITLSGSFGFTENVMESYVGLKTELIIVIL